MPPIRRCVVCRGREEKSALARLVWDGAALVWDMKGRRQCRGAYVHPTAACGAGLTDGRRLTAALRIKEGGVTNEHLRLVRNALLKSL